MIEKIKEMIKQNKEIYEILQDCSDDFIMHNSSIILAALDTENIKKDHKIIIELDEDGENLLWTYAPTGQEAIKKEKILNVKRNYTYKLPEDLSNMYLLDINTDVQWSENKRPLSNEFKRMLYADSNNQQFERGIWIHGWANIGKTHSSIALLNKFASKGKTVAFVNVSDLRAKTQATFNLSPFNNSDNYIEQIRSADVVVLDDLGSERPTPWFKENVLLPIIDFRFKANKLTIFTSNKSLEKYSKWLVFRSQNPESEIDTNNKIISRIKSLIDKELEVRQ